ncbi:Cell surface mannoprotein [Lachnellula occidentalis]|uniref:Cell surface mannoprotein n=1 Tax=Lachnellula occidentalis TaxID=215460 RepID=A0A8H8S4G8_9HELO|nr:Cell surface mannoprotein [Lachnellula occidentalis]
MKTTTIAIAAVSLLQLASAHPFKALHRHLHRHEKKDVVVTVVETDYAQPSEEPEVIVYVNQDGTPASTTTSYLADAPVTSATPTPTPVAEPTISVTPFLVASQPEDVAKPSSSSSALAYTAPVVPTAVASSLAAPPQTSSSAPSTSSSSSSEASGFGFSYSPYNSDNSCKTQDQVNTDFAKIGSGYALVRTYGTDCNQVATVLSAAKSKGLKLFAGIFDLASLNTEVATIVSAANGDWSSFDTISVGNELVDTGVASAATVVAAINTARGLLKAAGYTGKVVTVDTLVAAKANPTICDNSDYCAVNSHPFYDGNTVAEDSGSFLTKSISDLQAVLANKNQEIVITETGWPWQGETNDKAVPSPANQAAALSSIKTAFASKPGGVILFTAFNDMWKKNSAAQFKAEQYWGFLGNCPSG